MINSKTLQKIEQIIDSTINEETFRTILINCLDDKFKFSGENGEFVVLLDKNLQTVLGFANDTLYFTDKDIGGAEFDKYSLFYDGLNIILLTDSKNSIGATSFIYRMVYNSQKDDYIKAIKECIDYSELSLSEIFNLLLLYDIKQDDIEALKQELDSLLDTEVKNAFIVQSDNDKFINLPDEKCESLLSKIEFLVEPKLFIYQLYQNDFINFDEHVRIQELLNSDDEKFEIVLNQNAILALNLVSSCIRLTKDSVCGLVFGDSIDYLKLCQISNIDEPCKYGITQILLNLRLSPNEMVRNCALKNPLNADERAIFKEAVSFSLTQNPYFLGKDFIRNLPTSNKKNESVILKSSLYALTNLPLAIFDERFIEIVDKKSDIISNFAMKNARFMELSVKDTGQMIAGLTRVCKELLLQNGLQSAKFI